MGVTHAASHPTAVDEARAAVRPDDLLTIIYTSGTTGRPRGCRILQRNYAAMARIAIAVPGLVRPGDRACCLLPLAHMLRAPDAVRRPRGRRHDLLRHEHRAAAQRPRETKPHLLPTVPRALQAAHDGIRDQLASARGARRRLVRWALDVGERVANVRAPVSRCRRASRAAPARRRGAVPPRAGGLRRRDPRDHLRRRGPGARDRAVPARARPPGAGGLRTDGVHHGGRLQPAAPLPRGHRRAGPAPRRARLAEDGEIEMRGPTCSPATTATTRRPPRCSSTAGCARATSARSTTTASCTSRTASAT